MFLEQIDKEKIEVSRYKDIKTVMTDMNDAMSFVYFDSAKVNGEDKDVIMGLWFKENENGYRLYFPWIKIDDDLNEYFKRITNNEDKGEVISGTFNALSFNGSEDIVTDEILTNLYNENKNKVVQITGMDGNGSNTYGSGFFLRKGIVVTTWSLFLQFLTNSNYIYVNDCNGNTYNVLGVVAADANYDVVVLKIDGNVGEEVKLGESISLKTDDKLFMINSKYNSGFSISYGSFISQENGRLRNLFLLGNSDIGAALFDNQGNVVGINVGDQLYSELSYANSTDYLKKLQDVLIKKSYGNITYTILDTFKQEYYYSLNDEVNYNYIDKNVWEEYKNIGDIETNITLPLVKGSYKDKVLSLRYKVNGSESIEVMYFVSDYIDNLIKDGYILTYEDRLKKVFKNDKYKVVIKSNFISGILTLGLSYSFKVRIKEYNNNDFKIKYDTTWKITDKKKGLELEHKKSGSVINIQCKILDKSYMDTKLKDIIVDIKDSIEDQNKEYKLININNDYSFNYDSYSYLYENEEFQTLVSIYKKDNKIIFIYYEADSEYYDVVLDSAENIFSSLEIITGELIK